MHDCTAGEIFDSLFTAHETKSGVLSEEILGMFSLNILGKRVYSQTNALGDISNSKQSSFSKQFPSYQESSITVLQSFFQYCYIYNDNLFQKFMLLPCFCQFFPL